MHRGQFLFLALLCFFSAAPVLAQEIPLSIDRPVVLRLIPEYPHPGEPVVVRAESSSLNMGTAAFTWYQNGKEITRGEGVNEIQFTAGDLGSKTSVAITVSDGEVTTNATLTFRPAIVDIVWESDAYAPPFYRGRVFPGPESAIKARAIVRFIGENGLALPESTITYNWYRNGTYVASASGRGRSSITIPAPSLSATDTITVRAEALNAQFVTEISEKIPGKDPALLLYENHPLFGVLFHRALQGSAPTFETEQSVYVVPYFANVATARDANLRYSWTVNGIPAQPDPQNPQGLTITAGEYEGPASIAIELTSITNMFLRSTGVWELIFGGTGQSTPTSGPFGIPN